MPNPYHDETGKFCSPGEMLGAVSRLISHGDWDTAHALQQEYEQINKASVNAGFNEETVQRNTTLTKIGGLGENRASLHPDNIIFVQDWSDEELEAQTKIADKKIGMLEKNNAELEATCEEISNQFKKDTNLTVPPQALEMEIYTLKPKGEVILDKAFNKALEAGVPRNFARYYVYDRVAPTLGIKDGTDYQGRAIRAKSLLSPFNVNQLPKVKEVERREKLAKVFAELQEDEDVKKFNDSVAGSTAYVNRAVEDAAKIRAVERRILNNKGELKALKRARTIVEDLKGWRSNLASKGLSPQTRLMSSGAAGEQLKVDDAGQVNNAWGVRNGNIDRIVAVEKLGYPAGAGHMVGESGNKYYDLVHYHSFRTHPSKSYVLVDPEVKGNKYSDVSDKVAFSYTIDSGD